MSITVTLLSSCTVDVDFVAIARHRFVDRVVHHFPDQVVQALLARRADVHRGTQSHRLQAAENFDRCSVVAVSCSTACYGCFLCHVVRAPAQSRGKAVYKLFWLAPSGARTRSVRPSPYPVALSHRFRLGLVGFLLHPVRIPIARKRTRRRLLSSRLVASRILWRGHANQGRDQPGRRAVLEEND